MMIPAPVVELNETHAAFDEAAGQQAVVGEAEFAGLGAVHLVDGLGLLGDIGHLGNGGLHSIGELVLLDAGGDFWVRRWQSDVWH